MSETPSSLKAGFFIAGKGVTDYDGHMLITSTQIDHWVLPVEVRDADGAWYHPRYLMTLTSVSQVRRSCLLGCVK